MSHGYSHLSLETMFPIWRGNFAVCIVHWKALFVLTMFIIYVFMIWFTLLKIHKASYDHKFFMAGMGNDGGFVGHGCCFDHISISKIFVGNFTLTEILWIKLQHYKNQIFLFAAPKVSFNTSKCISNPAYCDLFASDRP